jgi:acyl carrier protein
MAASGWASRRSGSTEGTTGTARGPSRRDQDNVDNDAAFEKFKGCAVEVLQVPAEKVTPDARFDTDLDADSLDLVELVMALEEAFDITVEESELEGVETIAQAFGLVTSKI